VNLTSADLRGADLADVDLENATAYSTNLTDANLAGTDLAGATLGGITSVGITGVPAALPVPWTLERGYLLGPAAVLPGASLSGLSLAGVDLALANLAGATFKGDDLTGADLRFADGSAANLSGTTLTGADISDTDLPDADLASANLANANLGAANLTGADLSFADLTDATLAGATVVGARFRHVIWHATICPDGSYSNDHADGCFSPLEYHLAGFVSPHPGATVAKSSRELTVRFRLELASGQIIDGGTARSLARDHVLRASFTGPGVEPITATCGWLASGRAFACSIRLAPGVRAGSKARYAVTAIEKIGPRYRPAPPATGVANPETIHFK
jgi:uncharacterized protein YjbI with pentapeptide repeats